MWPNSNKKMGKKTQQKKNCDQTHKNNSDQTKENCDQSQQKKLWPNSKKGLWPNSTKKIVTKLKWQKLVQNLKTQIVTKLTSNWDIVKNSNYDSSNSDSSDSISYRDIFY